MSTRTWIVGTAIAAASIGGMAPAIASMAAPTGPQVITPQTDEAITDHPTSTTTVDRCVTDKARDPNDRCPHDWVNPVPVRDWVSDVNPDPRRDPVTDVVPDSVRDAVSDVVPDPVPDAVTDVVPDPVTDVVDDAVTD